MTQRMSWAPSGHEVKAPRHLQAQRAEDLVGGGRGVGDDEQHVAGRGVEGCGDRGDLVGLEELGDRRAPQAVGTPGLVLDEGPHQALGPVLLGQLGEGVEV